MLLSSWDKQCWDRIGGQRSFGLCDCGFESASELNSFRRDSGGTGSKTSCGLAGELSLFNVIFEGDCLHVI